MSAGGGGRAGGGREDPSGGPGAPGRWRGLGFPLVAFAIWRLAHGLVLALVGGAPLASTLAWDAHWYVRIMRAGYLPWPQTGATQATAFFPLVPWIGRGVGRLLGSERAAVLVVANGAALAEAGFALPRGVRWAVLAALGAASLVVLALAGNNHFVG